ncbi:unnamed protein product [Rhodiola kirilowii]
MNAIHSGQGCAAEPFIADSKLVSSAAEVLRSRWNCKDLYGKVMNLVVRGLEIGMAVVAVVRCVWTRKMEEPTRRNLEVAIDGGGSDEGGGSPTARYFHLIYGEKGFWKGLGRKAATRPSTRRP